MVDKKKIKAKEFLTFWEGKGNEKSQSQLFWTSLLVDVFGVEDIKSYIEFEDKVKLTNTSFIDVWIPTTKVLIEQKSIDKNLNEKIKQSDGSFLTPYQQAQRYNANRPYSKQARWIITCNFKEFYIYDMEHPGGDPEILELKNLDKEYERLKFLIDVKSEHIKKEEEISKKAGNLVGVLYNALLNEYKDKDSVETLKSLNILCVRLVFCLYAEDAGLFNEKNQFVNYFKKVEINSFRSTLIEFFKILNTPYNERDPYINPELNKFPYVNGGLFSDVNIIIPQFTEKIKSTLLENCGSDFTWADISPTIFGAIFESTLNPETRRSGGMHYTSIENIHKVIDPLFLNDINNEFEEIASIKIAKIRNEKIDGFINKISKLIFLDPAAGSGNFLTETYRCLRSIENKCLRLKFDSEKGAVVGQINFADTKENPIKVSIHQFYGIEINDFAVTVAKTALWIAEAQMLKETEEIIHQNINYLPLKTYANIVEGNALRLDWDYVINGDKFYEVYNKELPLMDMVNGELKKVGKVTTGIIGEQIVKDDKLKIDFKKADYIMGNPPFVGAKLSSNKQKEDIDIIFKKYSNKYRKLDYVSCWYVKACEYMQNSNKTKAVLVSTNSITQGEQVEILWNILLKLNCQILFAWKTFKWGSESNDIATVHCVIIGFNTLIKENEIKNKKIYDVNGIYTECENINLYLNPGETIVVEKRQKPLLDGIPEMVKGSQLIDGGNFIFENIKEKDSFIKKYPESEKYIFEYCNADAYLNNREQKYCLCLKGADAKIIKECKGIYEKVKAVEKYRSESNAISTNKLKDKPMEFFITNIPKGNSILFPVVSSERRRYIPIGYISKKVIYTNATNYIDDATIYHFAILTSNVHMAWMRAVAGRLEMRYRYSKDIVYNNFPWPIDLTKGDENLTNKEKELIKRGYPTIDKEMKKLIEESGKKILKARENYKNSSLADLYDELAMPSDLRKAHQENDKLICKAYGFNKEEMTKESFCVAKLFSFYKMIV